MKIVRGLTSITGYLLYTLIVLGLLLWYLFPADAARQRLTAELHRLTPNLQWHIGKVGLGLPAAVRLTDIEIRTEKQQKTTVFSVQALSLQPDLRAYLQEKELAAGYRLDMLGGEIRGRLRAEKNRKTLVFDGVGKGLQLQGVPLLQFALNRTVTGVLSGSFSGKALLQGDGTVTAQGDLALAHGILKFQEPVLGMEQLAYTRIAVSFTSTDQGITLSTGKMQSSLLAGEFTGTIKPQSDFSQSIVHIKGTLAPRPEFLTAIGDAGAVNILKKQLKDGKLAFTINGTVKEPGIVFTGLPADFNQQLPGGR